jgi:hypothetical protein
MPTGTWDAHEGGAVTAEDLKYSPGGMAPQVSLGGRAVTENIVLRRLYDPDRDHNAIHLWISWVGKASCVVTKQLLDVDGNAFGRPLVYRGKLIRVTPPNHDSESNTAARLEVEISTAGTVG